jgi:uncharacterized membrane protein
MQPPMTVPGSRMSAGRVVASAIIRITQLGLVALGLGLVFLSGSAGSDLAYLVGWDLLVGSYLAIGFAVARRRRTRPDPARPGGGIGRVLTSARLSFGFAILASLVGVGSLSSALSYGGNAAYGQAIRLFGGTAIIAAWLLLHAGYASFYASRYYVAEAGDGMADPDPDVRGGLEFPRDAKPTAADFLYFSFSIGTSFAVSDVNVTTQGMRWHVMVHSVLSFFYNAVVLAAAIGFLLGK